jgi:hypothetical protein
MKAVAERIPFPFVGYLFILIGFGGLGLFVAALAHGMPAAPLLGTATVAAYGAGTACFLYRRHQMRTADPSDPKKLHFDPMVPATEKSDVARYLRAYRGLGVPEESTSVTSTPPVRRRHPGRSTPRATQMLSPRRVPSAVAR